jgi:hypothetical protein
MTPAAFASEGWRLVASATRRRCVAAVPMRPAALPRYDPNNFFHLNQNIIPSR